MGKSKRRNIRVFLFILGFFLIALGVVLCSYTETVTIYADGLPKIDYPKPLFGIGAAMVVISSPVLTTALVLSDNEENLGKGKTS